MESVGSFVHGAQGADAHRSLLAGALAVVLALVAGAAMLAPGRGATAGPASSARAYVGQAPLELRAQLASALARSRAYSVGSRDGRTMMENPAQRLAATFGAAGVGLSSGALRATLALRAVGAGASLARVAPAAPRAAGRLLTYARHGVREWYLNGPRGIEQGFTVARPSAPGAGPLTLALRLSGNAHARLAGGALTLSYGGASLRYGGLSATGAGGHALRSFIELDGTTLLLRVETRGARWPVRIDPYIQQAERLHPGSEIEGFGEDVALSANGETALVGAPNFFHSGVYVFVRSGATWSQQGGPLVGSGAGEHALSGSSLALSADGDTALVGASGEGEGTGAAWVFTRSESTWSQQAELTGAGEAGQGGFGDSAALSADGNTAVIGGVSDNGEAGAVWTFTRSGESWTQSGEKLTEPGNAGFGRVALSGDGGTLLVGENKTGGGTEGNAWLFVREGEAWREQQQVSGVGNGVALSGDGNVAMVGGFRNVAVFARSGEAWTRTQTLQPAYVDRNTGYVPSVAISSNGQVAVATDALDNAGGGAAFVFERSGETWTQQAEKLTPTEVGPKAELGASVAVSEDGSTILLGGPGGLGAWPFTNVAYAPSAGAPEFGECLPVSGGTGAWTNKGCSSAVGSGKYEWLPDSERQAFQLDQVGGATSIGPLAGSALTCRRSAGSGAIDGYQSVSGVVLHLEECELAGQQCTSAGAAAGVVVSEPLEGVLGVTRTGATPAKDKIGLALYPAGHSGPVLEASCGASAVAVRGAVIGPVKTGRMGHPQLTWAASSKGAQKPRAFAGGPNETLEASVAGEPFAGVGLSSKAAIWPDGSPGSPELEVNAAT